MHNQSSGTGETIYLVEFEDVRMGGLLVSVPGPATPDARAEAIEIAKGRRAAGEVIAWASVGTPTAVGAEPVEAEAVA